MPHPKACQFCGSNFLATHKRLKFCSVRCGSRNRANKSLEELQGKFHTFLANHGIPNTHGCQEWIGPRATTGYGMFYSRKLFPEQGKGKAHRAAWALFVGPIPVGAWILHRCDNKICVNINHLYLGDFVQNMADRTHRRRTAQGARHYKAKLTPEQRDSLIEERKAGATIHALSLAYGISQSQVSQIARGKAYKYDGSAIPLTRHFRVPLRQT